MTRVTNIYKKDYSEIKNIQHQSNIYYNLIKTMSDTLTCYGIEIILKNNSTNLETANFEGISESKTFVLDIIKFLYENSIKPDSSLYIISDLISAREYDI